MSIVYYVHILNGRHDSRIKSMKMILRTDTRTNIHANTHTHASGQADRRVITDFGSGKSRTANRS